MITETLQWKHNSAIGPLYIVVSASGLRGIFWKKQNSPLAESLLDSKLFDKTIKQVDEYLSGKRKVFTLPIGLHGTEFQLKVWHELLLIPFGETRSYKQIAIRLKNEKAVRAVGLANGKNPISIIVPCHRVIGSNGTLTGYAGGLKIKKHLLSLESTEKP